MERNFTVEFITPHVVEDKEVKDVFHAASTYDAMMLGNGIKAAKVRCEIYKFDGNGDEKVVAKNVFSDSDANIVNAIETATGYRIRVICGSKAYANDGIVVFVPETSSFDWPEAINSIKALGVLAQPGPKFSLDMIFNVVEKAFDGAVEVTRRTLEFILRMIGKDLDATAVKIADITGLKAVFYVNESGETADLYRLEQGNFKGAKPCLGKYSSTITGHAVATDIEYRNCGTWLSYQVLDNMVNGPSFTSNRLANIVGQIKLVSDGMNGDRSWNNAAKVAALNLLRLRSAINDDLDVMPLPSDWDDSVSTAMHLLEIGVNPQHNKRLFNMLSTILAVRMRDCLKGCPLSNEEMVSGLAIPDNNVPAGKVFVGSRLECKFVKALGFRYPVPSPDGILTLDVVTVPGSQIRINPSTWAELIADFDGDIIYLLNASMFELHKNLGVVHGDKTAGKVEQSLIAEVRGLHSAARLIGQVELIREFITNLALTKGLCLDGLARRAAKAYNDSLQAKNRDVSILDEVRFLKGELKALGYDVPIHPARLRGLKQLPMDKVGYNTIVEHCRAFRNAPDGWEKTCRGSAAIALARPNVLLKDAALMRDDFRARVTSIVPENTPLAAYQVFSVIENSYHAEVNNGKTVGSFDFKGTREWIKKISTEAKVELPNKTVVEITPEIRAAIAYFAAAKIASSKSDLSTWFFDHFRNTELSRFFYGVVNDIPKGCKRDVKPVTIIPN